MSDESPPRLDEIATEPTPVWHPAKRLALRFAAVYALLYTFPFPLNYIPGGSGWFDWARDFEWWAIDLLAAHLFGIVDPLDRPWGSGDPTHSYIRLVLFVVLALVGAFVWLGLDKAFFSKGNPEVVAPQRPFDTKLAAWLHIGVRYYLAMTLLSYGFAKVFPNQFPSPMLSRLLAPFGDSSPMNVLWTFMGASAPYVIFAGAGEVLGGLLLLLRRTATLGALVAIGVMTNVVALNFMYDVPVKLYSSHLLLFAVCLVLPDAGRLLRVMLLNRPTERRDVSYPCVPKWAYVVKGLAFVYLLFTMVSSSAGLFESQRQRPELWGIWDVETFHLDGQALPPLRTDPVRWQNLVIERDTFAAVRGMDDTRWNLGFEHDAEAGTVSLRSRATWTYEQLNADTLRLHGEFQRVHKSQPWAATADANPATPRAPQVEIRLERVADIVQEEVVPEATVQESTDTSVGEANEASETSETSEASEAETSEASDDQEKAKETVPLPAEVHGRWQVAAFDIIGDTYTPRRRSAPSGWVVLELAADHATVEYSDGLREVYQLAFDTVGADQDIPQIQLTSAATFTLEQPSDERLHLVGERGGHQLEVDLRRRDLDEFLVYRGFHWINEIPLNRF